jgi:hypothetical protein
MRRIKALSGPVVIAAVGGLTLGTAGTAVAGHLITGKDIKNHTITKKDLSPSINKALKPATNWYAGHAQILNQTKDSVGYASPIGFSVIESSSTSFVRVVGPPEPTTLTSLTVSTQNAPGTTSVRQFHIVVNGTLSKPCVMQPAVDVCTVTLHQTIPKFALIYFESDVETADAEGADAAFGWTTKG